MHPLALAWRAFTDKHPSLLDGPVGDVYLRNRLNVAFNAGWLASKKATRDAIHTALDAPREVKKGAPQG
jgi:hypothetical protein